MDNDIISAAEKLSEKIPLFSISWSIIILVCHGINICATLFFVSIKEQPFYFNIVAVPIDLILLIDVLIRIALKYPVMKQVENQLKGLHFRD